jgi:hypothetical protein
MLYLKSYSILTDEQSFLFAAFVQRQELLYAYIYHLSTPFLHFFQKKLTAGKTAV